MKNHIGPLKSEDTNRMMIAVSREGVTYPLDVWSKQQPRSNPHPMAPYSKPTQLAWRLSGQNCSH